MKLKLKYWRTRRALSIDALAAKAEMSTQTIVNLEKNRQPPRPGTIQRLAEALDINVDDLIEVEDYREYEIPEPSVEELEEAALAFQEAAAERAAGTLSTSADIRRMAADVLVARRSRLERASA